MLYFELDTGEAAAAPNASEIDSTALGARYVSYRNDARFEAHIDEMDPGLIVWPGGDLAERRDDRFGFEYDDLYNDTIDRPGLTEMMAFAVSQDAALSVVLPTVRYLGRENDLRNDVQGFMEKLLGGDYGPLPNELILEVGSEYYAYFEDGAESAEAHYATLADIMVTEIALSLNDTTVNPGSLDVTIAVQAGRELARDADIRDGLSDYALQNTEMVIHHRFPVQTQGFDGRIDDQIEINNAWEQDVQDAGGDEPEMLVSAWNVAQLTRGSALSMFLDDNDDVAESDVDLEARNHVEFERYWQSLLQDYDYGARHPGLILEGFSTFAEAGMDAGAVFGVDVIHPGRLSWRDEQGDDHLFAGGEMLKMIYESVEGTRALASDEDYDRTASATTYAFEGDDKLIVFVAAGADASTEVGIEIDGLGSDYVSVFADRLAIGENAHWMTDFGIVDNPHVDESPEAGTYAPGARTEADVSVYDDAVVVQLGAHEVVRLAFAKTADAAHELSEVSEGDEVLLQLADLPVLTPPPGSGMGDLGQSALSGEGEGELDAGGAGGMLGGLILPLLLLLL